ncbi:MAG: type IVB secretion system protein IcmH/DotU [Gammaproteobacteria bacterium]|nr:type IVB secretion system protein IcmH/DotU [Gammaproteobacteria bacterium]
MNKNLEETLSPSGIAQAQSITGLPSSSLVRAPLSGTQTHSQSKVFNAKLALNPLVAIAAPLLTLAGQLNEDTQAPDFKKLYESLCYEIKILENKTIALGYRSQTILGARYLLCALIDEILLNTHWDKPAEWENFSLLNSFQRESWGGERFFIILERSAEDPALYIDLLELGYLCLSLGFQGKYRQHDNLHELALFIDNLYDLIRRQRGEISRRLLVTPSSANRKRRKFHWLPPIWLTTIATCSVLVLIFLPYYKKLDKLSTPIKQAIVQIGHANNP